MGISQRFNRIKKLKNQLQNKCEICQHCLEKKLYKCMQPACASQKLICPQCDVYNLKGNHFDHKFIYVLPLYMETRPQLILNRHEQMQNSIMEIKSFLQRCIVELEKVYQQNKRAEEEFNQVLRDNKLTEFLKEIKNVKNIFSLDDMLNGVRFLTTQECRSFLQRATAFNKNKFQVKCEGEYQESQEQILKKIIQEFEQINMPEFNDLFNPFFLLNEQTITIEKQDSKFRDFKQLYSDNWAFTSVQIKLGDKSGVESSLFHFQQCRKLEVIQQANSTLLQQQPGIQEWISFPNLRQITIRGDNILLDRIKTYCSNAQIINVYSPAFWKASILKHFKSKKQINLFFNNKQSKKDNHFSHLQSLLNSRCSVISIMFQEVNHLYWSQQVLSILSDLLSKRQQKLIKLYLNSITWRLTPKIFKQVKEFPKLLKFSVPMKQLDGQEIQYTQEMVDQKMKQLNKKGLEKEKAVTSLIKEYKLKKFIREEKTRYLFEDLYTEFLSD